MNLVGTTILSAITTAVDPSTEIVYSENLDAEDRRGQSKPTIPEPGIRTIENVCVSVKCVVVLISERPLVIKPYLSEMDTLVAAWLPGSEGQGVTNVLYMNYGFTGKLSMNFD
ncbi:Glycoside hydrolase family 3 C-terminal domain [Macleaya cordata]|uniref:beta-glucosidase n=1 Tax=Macleaya cordata TaxID=56857 RepID=A0A200Q6B2_MACCD|nr:Glycoside hydrolase family 3 C-terminal domain [Macleaya cordata]